MVGRAAGEGVGPAHQQVGSPDPVPGLVDRQQAGDDHRGAGRHRRDACPGLLGPWLAREQPEVDHPAAALTDQLVEHHSLELLRAVEQLRQPSTRLDGGDGHRRVERVVGLHRAATGRVGIQQDRLSRGFKGIVPLENRRAHSWPARARCRATMPPDRLRHSTSDQPGRPITAARADWSGQAWMDSARYS